MFKIQNAELALQMLYEITHERPGTQTLAKVSWDELIERMQSRGVSPADTEKALIRLVEQKRAMHIGVRIIRITADGADAYENSDEGTRDPKALAKVQNGRLALQVLYLMADERPGTQTNVMIMRDQFHARMQSHGVSPEDTDKAFGWLVEKRWARYVGGQMVGITAQGQSEFESIIRN